MNEYSVADDIEETLVRMGISAQEFKRLPSPKAAKVIEAIKQTYVEPVGYRTWWWEHFKVANYAARFKDDKAYLRLSQVVPESAAGLWFVVGEDEWPVYQTSASLIQKILGEGFAIEYYIVPPDLGWLVCENHHGYLIAIGSAPIENLQRVVENNPQDIL